MDQLRRGPRRSPAAPATVSGVGRRQRAGRSPAGGGARNRVAPAVPDAGSVCVRQRGHRGQAGGGGHDRSVHLVHLDGVGQGRPRRPAPAGFLAMPARTTFPPSSAMPRRRRPTGPGDCGLWERRTRSPRTSRTTATPASSSSPCGSGSATRDSESTSSPPSWNVSPPTSDPGVVASPPTRHEHGDGDGVRSAGGDGS